MIATKFFPRTEKEQEQGISVSGHIFSLVEQSLQNLQTEYIDLLIYHMWDFSDSIEEVMGTLDQLVRSGKVKGIGISNCFAWQLAKANCHAKANDWIPFITMQGHYNLLFREEERELIPYCRSERMVYTAYSPLASGRLVNENGETSKRLKEDIFAQKKYESTEEQDAEIIQ